MLPPDCSYRAGKLEKDKMERFIDKCVPPPFPGRDSFYRTQPSGCGMHAYPAYTG